MPMPFPRYHNLPTTSIDWTNVVEPAKDAYWAARREGKSESDALLDALDQAFKRAAETGWIK